MHAAFGVRRVPDFGSSVARPRLVSLAHDQGIRPLVVAGSSGSGKSVLAAQLASDYGAGAIWVDAAGASVRPTQVRDAILESARRATATAEDDPGASGADSLAAIVSTLRECAGERGIALVLDDVGDFGSEADCEWLQELGRALWNCSSRLIVTTRSVDSWPTRVVCEWSMVDGPDLALRCDEARQLTSILGCEASDTEIECMRDACAGHVAFFSAMATQARHHGMTLDSARTPSLEAWLHRAIGESMSDCERRMLCLAGMLHSGSDLELLSLGFEDANRTLDRLAMLLPLVRLHRRDGGFDFLVHDLVDGYYRKQAPALCAEFSGIVTDVLTDRGDCPRAATVLINCQGTDERIAWLRRNGQQAVAAGHFDSILRLIASVPTSALMKHASVIVLWARVLLETGRVEDALAKARAARPLAQYERDYDSMRSAIVVSITGLRMLGRIEEASALAEEVIEARSDTFVDDALLAEALLCLGAAKIMTGEIEAAEGPLVSAIKMADSIPGQTRLARMARNAMALMPTLIRGDFAEGKRILSSFAEVECGSPRVALMFKGNLAAYLIELGRCSRAESLVRSVLRDTARYGLQVMDGSYLPVLGAAIAGAGDLAAGAEVLERGIAISEDYGDTSEAAVNRTYLALVLLANGLSEDSLGVAERAFESLAEHNTMGYGRLAALGIAAAMLALGDGPAARSWVAASEAFGPQTNLYHNLRAQMILAEADRRDGSAELAIQRLAGFAEYVRSESANWQVALFSRSFPHVMGLVTTACGVAGLPAHLLRMIPPESSEAILFAAKSTLDAGTWDALGERLLGRQELSALVRRGGTPLCHVRLFGGFEVSIGGRTAQEADWRKRKARLLFAILVLDQGRGLARERIFEYLWPDMDQSRAQGNLYVIWSAMKRVLMGGDHQREKCPYVVSIGGVCQVVKGAVRSDVGDFECALADARSHELADQPLDALRDYRHVAELYRGDLLSADCYDDWFASQRQYYRAEFLDAMLRAGSLMLEQGDPLSALMFIRRALQVDPSREDLYQSALKCQIAAGQRSSAIDTYFQCRSHLADELGLDPSAETRALYSQVLAMEDVASYGAGDLLLE